MVNEQLLAPPNLCSRTWIVTTFLEEIDTQLDIFMEKLNSVHEAHWWSIDNDSLFELSFGTFAAIFVYGEHLAESKVSRAEITQTDSHTCIILSKIEAVALWLRVYSKSEKHWFSLKSVHVRKAGEFKERFDLICRFFIMDVRVRHNFTDKVFVVWKPRCNSMWIIVNLFPRFEFTVFSQALNISHIC